MKILSVQCALTGALTYSIIGAPTLALADVKYTTVTSVAMGGALKPMSTVTTWLKPGLERTDSAQDLGIYKASETTISNRAKKQRLSLDLALKIYTVEALGASKGAPSSRVGNPGSAEKAGTGTFTLTVGAKFLGGSKMLNYPVRHYSTSMSTQSTGCCGIGNSSLKTETWMADVKLPVFDAGAPFDWKSAYSSPSSPCKVSFQRKGDVKGFEAAQKGLALKSITFDAAGKPITSSQITALSMSALTAAPFDVPAGFKKLSRSEYDAARSKAMMAAMTASQG